MKNNDLLSVLRTAISLTRLLFPHLLTKGRFTWMHITNFKQGTIY